VANSIKSVFQQAALGSSLLTQEELDEAVALLTKEGQAEPNDEQLASRLVALGRLNRWQAEQLRLGQQKFNLGDYHIIDSIGQGGMGHVFKAEHALMGRIVAVKVLPRSKSTPEAVASFFREMRAQAQLDHPNLVRAFHAGNDGNVYFLVTEYVPGADLRRLIRRRGKIGMGTAAVIITQAAKGLDHAHSRGLIHRDVKPGNLLVTPEGHTKVSDLGLAGYFTEDAPSDGRTGKIVGTADYLSPEQIMTPDRLTAASDIYSLGCTLYYSVTGKVPFPGGTTRDKARAHCQLPPIDPHRFNSELHDEFVEVIADMMAKSIDERIQTAADVVARLEPWSGDFEAAAAEIASSEPAAPPVMAPPRSRPIAVSMRDTETNFLIQPAIEPGAPESPSQASVGTQPVNAFDEETLPILETEQFAPLHPVHRSEFSRLPEWLQWMMILAVAVAGISVASIVLSWLFIG
jgi:serine/threonine protein kinase